MIVASKVMNKLEKLTFFTNLTMLFVVSVQKNHKKNQKNCFFAQ